MDGSSFTEGEVYQEFFNSRVYLETYYSSAVGCPEEGNHLCFELTNLFNIFSSGSVKGQKLIDIGTGPCLHQLLVACEWFEEIIVTDYTDSNHLEIEKWIRNDPDCFDWSAIGKFICEIEGNRVSWTEKKEKLRQRVKRVLKCDVTSSNPLHPVCVEPVDCLMTSLCLEAACKDQETYRNAVKNISTLLKPGGSLIMTAVLNETFYMVDSRKFSCLYFDKEFLTKVLNENNYIIRKVDIMPGPDRATNTHSDFESLLFLVAQKQF
ncbi:nicotinamide N-methyltransferase-like [Protopterus annectens]|uniref:nicotinamide N-methyltransferase-like n=1 Tax=Protopterus annectens TaxID=7888 RepID=UPI001CFA8A3B|nr:nicotinamide N-methyltransferase-like [Protopterus annectens]